MNVLLGERFKMKKISVSLSGHQTSISLEDEFITALNEIAQKLKKPVAKIIDEIDEKRVIGTNLSSAVRIYILRYYRK
ncbi:MAG: ribbon-helix-helix domain-containing protein [Alphaproteobacteria bacterium]|jgi:predicted DNA-binding ribbon-helix-helix protein|nr:ribbon-helix-helix domain-containing protein [Alphaproteobacteria bacterium]